VIPFEVFAFGLAAGAVVAIVLGVRTVRAEEIATLSGPPCPAVVRFRGGLTEFDATIDWAGPALSARADGGKLAIETKDDALFAPHVVSNLERLAQTGGGSLEFALEPGRMLLRIGRRLDGDEHPRFIACAYAIAQHAVDVQQRGRPPVV